MGSLSAPLVVKYTYVAPYPDIRCIAAEVAVVIGLRVCGLLSREAYSVYLPKKSKPARVALVLQWDCDLCVCLAHDSRMRTIPYQRQRLVCPWCSLRSRSVPGWCLDSLCRCERHF